ncbi:MAG TPA: site-2 protease family protein [Thermoanaerobaculia bacterium]|nr:site-2 protease family protein [Thermoanaerobaculia bacterium]
MSEPALRPGPVACNSCGSQVAPSLLVCPACHALVHRERLETLARDAEAAEKAHEHERAASLWREALSLLPQGSRQAERVGDRIHAMTAAIEGKTLEEIRKGPQSGSRWAKILGPLGVAGLLLWKFKFILVAILSKGKLLLLGLTKVSTVATLFVSLGVYWAAWGWKFAAAILAGIYIHEVGHVAELRRRGMAASAPMFIPGVGAFVRMHEHAATPSENARVGLAGPVWGLGAALAAWAAALATGSKFWFVIAQITAIINLFNLTPVWQLDGSRGFSALSRIQRWIAVAVLGAAWAITREGILVLVALFAIWRAMEKKQKTTEDWPVLALYSVLVLAFAALTLVVPR